MVPQRDIDVDQLAQEVVIAWGTATQAGNGKYLSTDFKALFDKTCAYRIAKNVADNRREHGVVTAEDALRQGRAKKEFLDAYRLLYETPESDVY
jgi:hypothetical protein